MARILVIDDDELVRGTVQAMLQSDGHEAVLAVDGEDGIRQVRRQLFDLVLCDVFMPQKEGLATVREIRQLSAGIPIISMTGSVPASNGALLDPDFLRMSSALGATRTLAKPFRPRELLALVKECLGSSGKAGES
jgi:two-component system, chemotaxis family, chemotaxis protein CheY